MTIEKLMDLVVGLLVVGIPAIVIGYITLHRLLGRVEKTVGVLVQRMNDSCQLFQNQIDALHREKDRILGEADREHERIESMILTIDREVKDYQSKFHVRSEDIIRITASLENLTNRVAGLQVEVSSLRDEVRHNGKS